VHAGDSNRDWEDQCIVLQRMECPCGDALRDGVSQDHGPDVASQDSIEFPPRNRTTRQIVDANQLDDPNES